MFRVFKTFLFRFYGILTEKTTDFFNFDHVLSNLRV